MASSATKKGKGVARTPPFPAYPAWSQAKFWGFLRAGLRAKAVRWPPIYEALAKAKRDYNGPNARQKFEYLCAKCNDYHPKKNISVDHTIPTGSLKSFDDLPGFCERLFVGVEGLQVLCDGCHQIKSNQERLDRGKGAEE